MLATFFPWFLYALAWILSLLAYYFGYSHSFLETLLFFVVLLNGGIQGIWAAIGHLLFPKRTAKKIGWEPCNFQTEMGGTNLAIGIVSILCFWNRGWIEPVGLIIAILFLVCAYVHIKDRIVNKNSAPCNSGPMLYNTMVVILTILITIYFK